MWKPGFVQNQPPQVSTLRSFSCAVLHTEASKRDTTPGGTQPGHDKGLICMSLVARSWKLRCTAPTQCYLLERYPSQRRSVSSSIRADMLGNFRVKNRSGEHWWKTQKSYARVYRQGRKFFMVMDSEIYVTDAAVGLRHASKKQRIVARKTPCFSVVEPKTKCILTGSTGTEIFRKILVRVLLIVWRENKNKIYHTTRRNIPSDL